MEVLHAHFFFNYVDKIWKKQIHNQFKDQWFYAGTDSDYEGDDTILQVINQRKHLYTPIVGDPLKFFNWFFEHGTVLFIEYFKNADKIQFGPSLQSVNRTNFFHEVVVKDLQHANQVKLVTIEFRAELEELFRIEQTKIKKVLQEQMENTLDITALHTYLLNVKKQLNSFRPIKLPPELYLDIYTSAFDAAKDQIIVFLNNSLVRTGYSELEINVNLLTPKERKNLLNEIYSMDIGDNKFIVDTPDSQEAFIQFFSRNANKDEATYVFMLDCKSNEAAIILDWMKRLHFSISYEAIERNKTFKTSDTSHLTASYISKAISTAKKKQSPKTLNEINAFFHSLESRYFYNKK